MDSSAEFMDIDEGRGGRHFVRRLGCAGMMSSVLLLTLAIIYVADAEHVDDAAMLAASEHEQLMLAEDGPVELQESWIPEVVDCQVTGKDQHSLVILLSTTLQGPLAVNTFQNMIRKLPGVSDSQLKVLLLEDAGLLKSSFWDSNDPNFGQKQGLNYEKIKSRTGMKISVEKVKEWTKGFQGLDGGWTADHAVDETLSRLFAREDFSYHSIFDSCASEAQAQALFDLQAQHVVPKVDMTVDADHPCVHEFRNILDQVSIILANGGNPDLLGFVWRSFAPEIGRMISERVRAGRLLYMGRSAGAMAASADFAYSYEPMPMLEEVLLKGDTSGLALAGSCSLRPHYGNQIWNIPARALAKARGQVGVLTPNGVGLACDQGQCFMVGPKPQQGPDIFQSPGSHLLRIYKAYEFAYKDYRPPRPNLVKSCRPQAPQCEGSGLSNTSLVMLGSGEMGRDAQEAFQTLLREVHPSQRFKARSKVLVLDDAALLTRSFWDSSDLDFSRPNVLNYIKAGLSTNVELVREATDGFAAMDEGWIPSSAALPGFDALDFSVGLRSMCHRGAKEGLVQAAIAGSGSGGFNDHARRRQMPGIVGRAPRGRRGADDGMGQSRSAGIRLQGLRAQIYCQDHQTCQRGIFALPGPGRRRHAGRPQLRPDGRAEAAAGGAPVAGHARSSASGTLCGAAPLEQQRQVMGFDLKPLWQCAGCRHCWAPRWRCPHVLTWTMCGARPHKEAWCNHTGL